MNYQKTSAVVQCPLGKGSARQPAARTLPMSVWTISAWSMPASLGGKRVTTGRQVPFCLFADPEFARVSLSEATAQGVPYRLFKIPMEAVMRASTLSETRGFLKALVELGGDRILGFTGFGVGVGEILSSVQIGMTAGLPYTGIRDAMLTHPPWSRGWSRCSHRRRRRTTLPRCHEPRPWPHDVKRTRKQRGHISIRARRRFRLIVSRPS